ncbi:MAG: class I SAM-dependent methyltransferase [Gemmataceae bacterium]
MQLFTKQFTKIKERLLNLECLLSTKWASSAHKRLQYHQWRNHHGIGSNGSGPGYYEHDFNLYWHWKESRDPSWVDRGVFGRLAMKGGRLLELSCGDGFNTRNFYSLFASHVIALDIDPVAVETANRKHSAPNIEYRVGDMRKGLPEGPFTNVVWDGGMEYMSLQETQVMFENIKTVLTQDGIFSGCAIIATEEMRQSPRFKHLIRDDSELVELLKPYFPNLRMFTTKTSYDLQFLFFWASCGELPTIQVV